MLRQKLSFVTWQRDRTLYLKSAIAILTIPPRGIAIFALIPAIAIRAPAVATAALLNAG
ncbi:hypothetical protein [Nostoc sp.]|uniref:hypothetical protein n=1 Tax=Nostoc sp. TaxID=1180 RepID=UPI0035946F53